eukprot:COSAG05_NODE_1080_length_5950_cov_1.563323_8_plen_102_part_00
MQIGQGFTTKVYNKTELNGTASDIGTSGWLTLKKIKNSSSQERAQHKKPKKRAQELLVVPTPNTVVYHHAVVFEGFAAATARAMLRARWADNSAGVAPTPF